MLFCFFAMLRLAKQNICNLSHSLETFFKFFSPTCMAILKVIVAKLFPNAPQCHALDCEKALASPSASIQSLDDPLTSSTLLNDGKKPVPGIANLTGRPQSKTKEREGEPGFELDSIQNVRAQVHETNV